MMIPMMLIDSRAPPALREPSRDRHGVSMTPQTSFSDVLVSRHRRACYNMVLQINNNNNNHYRGLDEEISIHYKDLY